MSGRRTGEGTRVGATERSSNRDRLSGRVGSPPVAGPAVGLRRVDDGRLALRGRPAGVAARSDRQPRMAGGGGAGPHPPVGAPRLVGRCRGRSMGPATSLGRPGPHPSDADAGDGRADRGRRHARRRHSPGGGEWARRHPVRAGDLGGHAPGGGREQPGRRQRHRGDGRSDHLVVGAGPRCRRARGLLGGVGLRAQRGDVPGVRVALDAPPPTGDRPRRTSSEARRSPHVPRPAAGGPGHRPIGTRPAHRDRPDHRILLHVRLRAGPARPRGGGPPRPRRRRSRLADGRHRRRRAVGITLHHADRPNGADRGGAGRRLGAPRSAPGAAWPS